MANDDMIHRMDPRHFRTSTILVCSAIAVAFALKLALILCTYGTNDISTWQHFADKISSVGGLELYRQDPLFNHPPFMVRLLRLWESLRIPLPISLRLTSSLADVGTVLLVWRLIATRRLSVAPTALFLMMLSPVSVLVSGFHGNTDPLMMFLVMFAIYFAETGRPPWLVGLALGASMNIKVVPVLLAPALFFWMDGARRRASRTMVAATGYVGDSL